MNAISKNLDGYGTPPIDWERVRDTLTCEITQAPDTGRVYLQGIGQVKVSANRAVAGQVKTIQIRREGRRSTTTAARGHRRSTGSGSATR
jgi:hypothetical protein